MASIAKALSYDLTFLEGQEIKKANEIHDLMEGGMYIESSRGIEIRNPLSTFSMEWDSTETYYVKIPKRELDHLDLPKNFTDSEHEELLIWFNQKQKEYEI